MAKKEVLKINETPATIFIGVGGIGSSIVSKVAGRCKPGEDENIHFVTMDTNANDIKDIKNLKRNIVSIQTSSTRTVLDYLKNDDDARLNWFPNNTTLYPKTVSEGAGQVRAISRLALNAAIQSGEIQKLYKAIDSLFLKDGGELKQALRVVVVSSASGGTGSGIAMIVGMLVRNYLHKHYRDKAAIIRGFLLMPGVMDTVIKTEQERESQRRNGYATIKEINGFMMKASGFCDVQKELERYKDLHIDVPTTAGGTERLENLPFDFCFLLERTNQNQEGLEVLEQYKEFAAQSLYEQNIGPMQRAAFGMEDNIIKEFANEGNFGRNRFGGIGAAIIRYPYDDIVDYVACKRAMEVVGDGETAGKWLKYDDKFREKQDEYKKNREITTENPPKIGEVYVQEIDGDSTAFGKDIKRTMVHNTDKISAETKAAIDNFMKQYISAIKKKIDSASEFSTALSSLEVLKGEIDYTREENQNHADTNKQTIRDFVYNVENNVPSLARAYSMAILNESPSLVGSVGDYQLESILRTIDGPMHPNAMRYMLYKLEKEVKARQKKNENSLKTERGTIELYSENADNAETFDVHGMFSKGKESSFDAVVALEKEEPTIIDKTIGGYTGLWKAFNEHFPTYSTAALKYYSLLISKVAYKELAEHVERLNREFENFYKGFTEKVVSLAGRREEIVEKLKFAKGDSIHYVCAKEKHLERFADICNRGNNGLMLPGELNAQIFESIKKNAEVTRMKDIDPDGDYVKINIFDGTLMGFFRESVENDSSETLDLNIVRAIEKEARFDMPEEERESLGLEKTKEQKAKEESEARERFLAESIRLGERLAAPGIGCSDFGEPRNVSVCAFSKSLASLQDIDVEEAVQSIGPSPVASDTVSKYDLRFFNAYYDITPDRLSRFRSELLCKEDEQYNEDAGIYCEAYQEHISKIGPDSTKCATISLHIDKRWDSLTELPELSLKANYEEMLHIHAALIYGVVHGMIKMHRPSVEYDPDKMIFELEDQEGERTTLIVSNKTECDEFYEVLDALYRDRASVAKIFEMAEKRRKDDENSNRKYDQTEFASDVSLFRIGRGHKGITSLFEIPLAYFNSLPRAKMDDNELSIMIDSVIRILEDEVARFELQKNREAFLTKLLIEQFELLINNFNNDEFNKDEAMRKYTTVSDNRVINMTFRKVSNKIKELKTQDANEKVARLRKMVTVEEEA